MAEEKNLKYLYCRLLKFIKTVNWRRIIPDVVVNGYHNNHRKDNDSDIIVKLIIFPNFIELLSVRIASEVVIFSTMFYLSFLWYSK